jgi:hypothetical protein
MQYEGLKSNVLAVIRVDKTGSGSCPMWSFGMNSVQPSATPTRISKYDLKFHYNGILIELLAFSTLSTVLFFYLKECFRGSTLPLSSGKKPAQFGPVNGASPCIQI